MCVLFMFVHNCGATYIISLNNILNIEKFNLNNRTTQQNSLPFPKKLIILLLDLLVLVY